MPDHQQSSLPNACFTWQVSCLMSTSQELPPKGRLLRKNAIKFGSWTLENVLGVIYIYTTWTSTRISSESFSPDTVLLQIHPLPSGKPPARFWRPFSLLGTRGGVQKTKTWMNTFSQGLDPAPPPTPPQGTACNRNNLIKTPMSQNSKTR